MWRPVIGAGAVIGLALASLVLSKVVRDRGAAGYLPRRLASALGGLAFLAAVVFLDVNLALALLGAITAALVVLKLVVHRGLEGVAGSGPSNRWSEVTFAVAGTASLAVGWGLLGNRWIGLAPAAFMAFGDNAAGLVRDMFCQDRRGSWWPSLVMLLVSLSLASTVRPYFVGALGAVAATAGERFRPVFTFWDDNLNLVTVSTAVLAILTALGPG